MRGRHESPASSPNLHKFLIITADDFGLHESVNEAVDKAHREGILTAASLMVSAPAALDAIARARRLVNLRVGLHLVLADGWATLPADCVPGFAHSDGYMDGDMLGKAWRFFADGEVRQQLEAEIRAQFLAFAQTGLALDHVNAHKHFQLHPSVLGIIIRVAREFGSPAIRLPLEPIWCAARYGLRHAAWGAAALRPWIWLTKQRLNAAGIFHNDRLYGMAATGSLDEPRMLEILQRLPPGVAEIYLHPAVLSGPAVVGSARSYRHADELAGLISPRVKTAVRTAGIRCGGYSDVKSGWSRPLA